MWQAPTLVNRLGIIKIISNLHILEQAKMLAVFALTIARAGTGGTTSLVYLHIPKLFMWFIAYLPSIVLCKWMLCMIQRFIILASSSYFCMLHNILCYTKLIIHAMTYSYSCLISKATKSQWSQKFSAVFKVHETSTNQISRSYHEGTPSY